MAGSVLLSMDAVSYAYPGAPAPLWAPWSQAWPAGLVLLRGGDGAGKTTLLRLLAGVLPPSSGQLRWHRAEAAPSVFWVDPRQPELPAVAELTPAQWLDTLAPSYPHWSAATLAEHLQGWKLAEHVGKPFYALSSGTQRKIFMAAALASGATLTLIDEPLGGLDRASIQYLQEALAARAADTQRLVLVAHYEVLPGITWDAVIDLPERL